MFDEDGVEIKLPQKTSAYAITRAAIDVQISTAKSYPRSLQQVGQHLKAWCTGDDATAESCIYSLTRGAKTIRGPSIRFAEILAAAWGHLRIDARIVDEGRDFIVVRGECHDLQSNNVWAQDVTRRITNAAGRRYDADLIGVTMMAAASIAQRDAVLKCIPAFIWRPAVDACLARIVGDAKTLNDRRIKAVGQFSILGVTPQQIFRKLGVEDINGITADHLVDLIGTFNAIRESETSIDTVFGVERISARSQGGSPLGAPDEDQEEGAKPGTGEPAGAGEKLPDQRVSGGADAGQGEKEKGKPDRAPAETGGPGSGADVSETSGRRQSAQRSKPAGSGRGRRDKDADVPPASDGAPGADPSPKVDQAKPAQPAPATAPAAETPKSAQAAQEQKQRADSDAKMSPEALLRAWEAGCEACETHQELQGHAVRYGPKFDDVSLNAEQEEMSRDIYEASKERIEKSQVEKRQREAAAAYERAQNGDYGPEDQDQQGADDEPAEPAPPESKPVSPMIERCNDMQPSDPKHLTLWHEIIEHLDGAATKQEVMDRYAELEKDGTIAKLPEDVSLNTRTVRFRIKSSKAS